MQLILVMTYQWKSGQSLILVTMILSYAYHVHQMNSGEEIAKTQPTTQNNLKQLLLRWYYNR
jgi:hypothetical protein